MSAVRDSPRDVKSRNLLLGTDGNFKHADFGLVYEMDPSGIQPTTFCGTNVYQSPELFRNADYDFKTDIWSLGCVIYECCTYKTPYVY